jgi:CheY-like chemotaxis protein
MDIQMDVMDGMESCQKIRQQQNIKQPYIIAVSANILGANKKQYQAIGMNDYISKPVDLQTLYQAIKQAITISN